MLPLGIADAAVIIFKASFSRAVADYDSSRLGQASSIDGTHRGEQHCGRASPPLLANARGYGCGCSEWTPDFSLSGAEVRPSMSSGTCKIAKVIFAYTNRNTDLTETFAVRVNVTEGFPFLVTKLSPYYKVEAAS